MKKTRDFHDNKSENISSESIGRAALIRRRRLLIFLSQMQRLFEGGAYSSKYGICVLLFYLRSTFFIFALLFYLHFTSLFAFCFFICVSLVYLRFAFLCFAFLFVFSTLLFTVFFFFNLCFVFFNLCCRV